MGERHARDRDGSRLLRARGLPLGLRLLPQRGLLGPDLLGRPSDLAYDFGRRFVFAHPLERSLAHELVTGPAAEIDLDHRARLEPFHLGAPLHRRQLVERRFLPHERLEPAREITLLFSAKTGADAARVAQAVLVVIAEQ
jgi:hypothetical protein